MTIDKCDMCLEGKPRHIDGYESEQDADISVLFDIYLCDDCGTIYKEDLSSGSGVITIPPDNNIKRQMKVSIFKVKKRNDLPFYVSMKDRFKSVEKIFELFDLDERCYVEHLKDVYLKNGEKRIYYDADEVMNDITCKGFHVTWRFKEVNN